MAKTCAAAMLAVTVGDGVLSAEVASRFAARGWRRQKFPLFIADVHTAIVKLRMCVHV
jgi:hypothetical protein